MHELEERLLENWPLSRWRDTRILVGVSGGADSVALLCALISVAQEASQIDVVHFNHCWRGAESDDDAKFVRKLCTSRSVGYYTARADDEPGRLTKKSEAAARSARYDFFTSVAYLTGGRYVATAHTASDRVETLLHNLFRGTGLAGVATPTRTRNLDSELVLVRPLLNCPRELVLDYLRSIGQGYRQDSSNDDQTFRRNYIRHQLLPLLREQYGENVDQRLLSFSEIAEEANNLFEQYAVDFLESSELLVGKTRQAGGLTCLTKEAVAVPGGALLPVQWPILRQALVRVWSEHSWPLQAMSRAHWEELRTYYDRLGGPSQPAFQLPGKLSVTAHQNWLVISPEISPGGTPCASVG